MMTQLIQTISPLRQRMIDDMNMCKLSPKTQIGYIRAVAKLSEYLKHSPAHATSEDVTPISDSIGQTMYIEYHHQCHVIRVAVPLL
jgi:hypothetical protein